MKSKSNLSSISTERQNDYLNYSGKFINCTNADGNVCTTDFAVSKESYNTKYTTQIDLENQLRGIHQLQKKTNDEKVINRPNPALYSNFTSLELSSLNQERSKICTK